MADYFVTETDPVQLEANRQAVIYFNRQQRRRDTLQATFAALIFLALILTVLALVALIQPPKEIPVLITYQSPDIQEPELSQKKIAKIAKPKPPGSSASIARVLASTTKSYTRVPVPETPPMDSLFGMQVALGPGFDSGTGSGTGGGGVTFFGSQRKGKRVAYIVDFSESMQGPRIAGLKAELNRSIKRLPSNMDVTVIFFSTNAWHLDTPRPEPWNNGWNGLNEPPKVTWYPANKKMRSLVVSEVSSMPVGGGTAWYPPLRLAFSMTPPPSIVYLLSDGEPRDAETVIEEMPRINPTRVPIDTIAFELPGTSAARLKKIAQATGGRFNRVHNGSLLR